MFHKRFVLMLLVSLALGGLLGKPVRADLTLTAAGTAAGFHLSTFGTGFPTFNNGGYLEGPLGIAYLSNGSVLVTNVNGEVRLFPNDADGQNAATAPVTASYSLANACGLVRVGDTFYTTQQASNVVAQVDSNGTFVQSIANVSSPTGLAVNPINGHLIVSTLGVDQIVDIDPNAKTASLFVNANADGIATDGAVLYAAVNMNQIVGYRISDGAVVYTSSTINNVDGLAVGTGVLNLA